LPYYEPVDLAYRKPNSPNKLLEILDNSVKNL
jgi:hypothetical protein